MPALAYNHVEISYDGVAAVHDFSAAVEAGEVLGIVGESGSGKSSLVKAAMGLLGENGMVTRGSILYDGRDLVELPRRELRRLCGTEIALVFQDCLAAFTPTRTIEAQLLESVRAHGACDRAAIVRRACDLLSRVNVEDPERILKSRPFELSGGLGQRVGIVLALVMEPKVLLADEPTSALDAVSARAVACELEQLSAESGCAIVLVTHNLALARRLCDEVVVLKDGVVQEQGPAREVLEHPSCPYTAQLLAAVPAIGQVVA